MAWRRRSCLEWEMAGEVLGRPRRRWMDEVMETAGLRLRQLKEAGRDRVGWKDVVKIETRGRLRPDGTR